jgi:hypothetical protein
MASELSVKTALSLPNFYQNQEQFWQMLDFIRKQDINLGNYEYHQLARQLDMAIENASNYKTIELSGENIYYAYFLLLSKLKGCKTMQNWMANEEKETLKHLHSIYKLLYSNCGYQLPGFGKSVVEKL